MRLIVKSTSMLQMMIAILGGMAALRTSQVATAEMNIPAAHRIVIVSQEPVPATAKHGIDELEQTLRARHFLVSENPTNAKKSNVVIQLGIGSTDGMPPDTSLPIEPESLVIRTNRQYQGKPSITLWGSDGTGLMYAALDVAQRVSWTHPGQNPFAYIRDTTEKPFLRNRGVVMFTMNRAYFESRLHDANYWKRYFDMLAEDRINQLVLTFGYEDGGYMAPFYPYFFDVPGYPDVKVVGLTAEEQQRNFEALRTMVRLAGERGIRIKPGIWEHIYRGGGQTGAIPWASDGTHPTSGLVWGLNSNNLVPYTTAALDRFYTLFPEIKETQFRMHNESGLKDSEIPPFWHEIFHFYATRHKDIELELRAKGLDKSVVRDAQSQGVSVHLDTKIWMEQMGLPYHPTHINKENQNDARQSYADLLEYPKTYQMNWTLWNGGSQRLLEWSDPDYARRLAEAAKLYDGPGLAVTEMEAAKMLGAPPADLPHNYLNSRYKYFDYEFERYWAFYRVMGRLAYNPATSPDVWEREYIQRFGPETGPHVMRAQQLSSQVLPRIVAASVPYSIFPTTSGWPEMMHLGSLPSYAAHQEGSDIAQFENVRDEAKRLVAGGDTAMRTPEETSRWLLQLSNEILQEVAKAKAAALVPRGSTNELQATLTDATILAALAHYHAARLMGGVNYSLYKESGSLPAFDAAVTNERDAVQAWRDIVHATGDRYVSDMYFGSSQRGFPHHWSDELPPLEKEFDQLQAERRDAVSKPGASEVAPKFDLGQKPPSVEFSTHSPSPARPGVDYAVTVHVESPNALRSIRLRYRHLNQKEDYLILPMIRDGQANTYQAHIPGTFITAQWDLMYYVEIVDAKGAGRIYPDLDKETPYVILPVDHSTASSHQ